MIKWRMTSIYDYLGLLSAQSPRGGWFSGSGCQSHEEDETIALGSRKAAREKPQDRMWPLGSVSLSLSPPLILKRFHKLSWFLCWALTFYSALGVRKRRHFLVCGRMARVQAFHAAGGMMEPTKEPGKGILREGSLIKMKLFLPSLSLAKKKKIRPWLSREKI